MMKFLLIAYSTKHTWTHKHTHKTKKNPAATKQSCQPSDTMGCLAKQVL